MTDQIYVQPQEQTVAVYPSGTVTILGQDRIDVIEVSTTLIEVTSRGITGPSGVPGPRGPTGGVEDFVYHQATPSNAWNIIHDLNGHPAITVVDTAGTVVFGDEQYLSANQILINFSAPFSGTAYLS